MRGIILLIGYIADLIIGDPVSLPHPIILIGNSIKKVERLIRKLMPKGKKYELFGGFLLTLIICSAAFLIPYIILELLKAVDVYLALAVEAVMCYQLLATKSLSKESKKVYSSFESGNIEDSRYAVSMIVGRDTNELSKEGVIKATVETVAENTVDGIISPMIFFAIGGAPLMFLYKAVNTLDSMVGYKNDEYLYFGRFSAKLDDVLNFIPARLAAIFMIIASFVLRYNWKNAAKIFKRDRMNHASPNSAQTESVCAGALEIQLAGDAYYFGKKYKKKTIGDNILKIEETNILDSIKLMHGTSVVCTLFLIIPMFIYEVL